MNDVEETEKRAHDRKRTVFGGQLIFPNDTGTLDCIVRNMSAEGALVEISSSLPLPSDFLLVIPKLAKKFVASRRWRRGHMVGLQFTDLDPHSFAQRAEIRRLEQEVAQLRSEIAEFRRRTKLHGVTYLFDED